MTNLDIEKENAAIAAEYRNLLKISYQTLNEEDKKLIRLAFNTAVDAHKDQRRKSGEAYIFHPIAVAKIVAAEIGLDAVSIAAALLHDVVEDTDFTLNDMERLFGETVARIVDGLTKISQLQSDTDVSLQAENFRKMLLTLHDDIRVIIIKIADRLHNMQTMGSMPSYKQIKIASETLYIYAPLAHRMGLYNIKTELEDLGLKYTEPEVFNSILEKTIESKDQQKEYIKVFNKSLENSLIKEGVNFEIKGRPKSIFSIRKKMLKQNVTFEEVYDKFAVRIIYNCVPGQEKFVAWKIYSIVTNHYRPNPVRLRDWISSPKSTGYEALHITVMGPEGKWVEVQIRSERMNEIAEKGYAAHYKYKQGSGNEGGLDEWLVKLQEALENQESNAVDFIEQFKLNLYSKEIFVFTPKGDLKSLPKGATSLDFAFSVHTQIGFKTRGTKVNGKLVPLSHVLKSGDQVEIITSENTRPTANWIDYVTTSRAKTKIKSSLNDEKKLIAAEGKEMLKRKLKQLKITLNDKTVNELVSFLNLKTSLDLYYRAGLGNIDNQKLKDYAAESSNAFISFFKKKTRKHSSQEEISKEEITANYDLLVFGKEEEKLSYKFTSCCKPIPGDNVFGFVTVSEGIKVHKKNCPNAVSLQANYAYRIIKAKWIDSSQQEYFTDLSISGIDQLGLVNNLTKIISNNMNVNMRKISFETDDGLFKGNITVSVKNKKTIDKLIDNIKKIQGIDRVQRS
jgi:GTP diphosphokinase / guanosine-3',5'-bis(diphosphate) 3'-diphosphatase